MKKLLFTLCCLPLFGFGQQTYIPDDNFESYLESNGMGNGIPVTHVQDWIKSSLGELGLGLVLAIFLAFLIITPLFRSFRLPLIIILTFPLGIIGVAFLLWATNTYLSIQAMMGIILGFP